MRRTWSPLRQRADFLRIAASGLRRVTPAFILQAAAVKTGEKTGRIGFTCSRKIGNAVARNRARRRLRAVVDQVVAPAMTETLDFVLVGRGEALTRDFAAMTQDLRHAIGKVTPKKTSQSPS
jgi:ribonuclease P protein component